MTHDGGTTWSAPNADLRRPGSGVRLRSDRHRRRPHFRRVPQHDRLADGPRRLRARRSEPGDRRAVFGPSKSPRPSTAPPIIRSRSAGRRITTACFASWAAGNITADPTDAAHLAVVWSDMRNSTLPAPANPYAAATNSDVIVSQSFDRGRTWSAPFALTLDGDQFMPWGAFDSQRPPAHRLLRSAIRSPQTIDMATRWRPSRQAPAAVQLQSAHDGAVRPDDRQPMVRDDGERVVSVRDHVPRRLLQHRDDAIGRRRGVLDRSASAGVLRRPVRKGAGRLLCDGALMREGRCPPRRSHGRGSRVT